jgi:hypothetical protein
MRPFLPGSASSLSTIVLAWLTQGTCQTVGIQFKRTLLPPISWGIRFFVCPCGMVGEKEKVQPRPRRRSSIAIVVLNTFILPTNPRDLIPLDVLRYDSCKLNTCHRYELLAVGALAGKREYDVTVIIGLPRASQTTSIPHQIHKRFPHVSTPHPHFARKQPCPNLFILYTLQNSACVGSGQNHGHFIRETHPNFPLSWSLSEIPGATTCALRISDHL